MKNGNGKITAKERRQARKSLLELRHAIDNNGGAVHLKTEKSEGYIELPQIAVNSLVENLQEIVGNSEVLTLQEVANFLNVSVEFVEKQIQSGELNATKDPVGSLKIEMDEAERYDSKLQGQRSSAMDEMVKLSQEMGLYDL